MVLPVLAGIAAAGFGGKMLADRLQNAEEDRDLERASDRNSSFMEQFRGQRPTADQFGRAAFEAGLIDPEEYARVGFGEQSADMAARRQFGLWQQQQGYLEGVQDKKDQALGKSWAALGGNPYATPEMQRKGLDQAAQYEGDLIARRMGWAPPVDPGNLGVPDVGVPGGDMAVASQVVAQLEGNGSYDQLGEVVQSGRYAGERAIGKYQVMPGNVASWTQEALGHSMTPDEFRNSPEAQEAVFQKRFGDAVRQYGVADALSIWHSGDRLSDAASRGATDGYMRTKDYASRGMSLYQGGVGARDAGTAADLAELDAGAGYGDALASLDSVLGGLNSLPRVGAANWGDTESQAIASDVEKSAFELRMQWQKQVYGDAEPPPAVQEEMAEIFGEPGGMFENRTKTANVMRLMGAELELKQRYDMLRARAEAGDRSALGELRGMNGGQLTRGQRMEYLRGDDIPEGLTAGESAGAAVPAQAGVAQVPAGRRGGRRDRRAGGNG